ncbi:L,D-transpeptidase [Williamsia sp. CHRR-6]|uniref:L,D-transpeptidase family protein n=1 Tax=Williamsia sp. CHRR-6 TaxID=2835871 RepID=UPI001BDA5AC9|nr:L,D-transpeptidase family protein [Williamsia sp. CHRR-6]MBT0566726.1 L,D-transpeptidase family protein [Williamsia sp. CHRR-6]
MSVAVAVLSGALGLAPAGAVPVATPPDASGPPGFPTSTQMVAVMVDTQSATVGTVTAWQRRNGVWVAVIGPVPARVGSAGIGFPADNVPRTPEGTFALDQGFGREPNPGTKLPYFQADRQDWWDELPGSPTYNTHVRQVNSPGGDSENLYDSGPVYDYAINIAHNPARRAGYASGIFLHVTDGNPTLGCVAVDKATMIAILRWIDPDADPVITIGLASVRA